jgi:hypothetical protein
MISKPLARNLLGYRILIINEKDTFRFKEANSKDIKQLKLGIPETWSDASIFRINKFKVNEKGSFDDVFKRLVSGEFDYTTFGANEVESIFKKRASQHADLSIENSLMFFYPFPLVFYVNPKQPQLAVRIEKGLKNIEKNGILNGIFDSYYKVLLEDLNLKHRKIITLNNPLIPDEFAHLKPDLRSLSL